MLLSIGVGVFLFYAATDVTIFIIERVRLAFISLPWQETLVRILFAPILGAPIAALAQRNSALIGALAPIVGDLLMFYYWLQAPPPRAEFGIGYFTVSVLYAGVFALSSHLWWVYAFKRRVAPSAG